MEQKEILCQRPWQKVWSCFNNLRHTEARHQHTRIVLHLCVCFGDKCILFKVLLHQIPESKFATSALSKCSKSWSETSKSHLTDANSWRPHPNYPWHFGNHPKHSLPPSLLAMWCIMNWMEEIWQTTRERVKWQGGADGSSLSLSLSLYIHIIGFIKSRKPIGGFLTSHHLKCGNTKNIYEYLLEKAILMSP